MGGLQDEIAEGAIDKAVRACGPRKPMLCAIIRAASRMLAESEGHDFVAQVCAGEARRHALADSRRGVRFGR
ncbi:hypothetical protein [Caulobacter sp. FWC2]|uniref:hypothetical protein n=1 Tax=Caulobacter sp. FWC2 TaxID=69664 RepID=UPI000C159444|nr:hypothetical protein [Caulobacter sp. FWC2]PIB91398.1 hypothetical protein CSW62_07295 [Caulobacter sp. FWC2]